MEYPLDVNIIWPSVNNVGGTGDSLDEPEVSGLLSFIFPSGEGAIAYGFQLFPGAGLNAQIIGGEAMVAGRRVAAYAPIDVVLPDDDEVNIYLRLDTDALDNATGATIEIGYSAPDNSVLLCEVKTANGAIVEITDVRPLIPIVDKDGVIVHRNLQVNGDVSSGGSMWASGDVASGGSMWASGDVASGGSMSVNGDVSSGGSMSVNGDVSSDGSMWASGDISAGGMVSGAEGSFDSLGVTDPIDGDITGNADTLDGKHADEFVRRNATGLKMDAYDDTGSYLFGGAMPSVYAEDPGASSATDSKNMLIPHGCTRMMFSASVSWSIPTSEADSWSWGSAIKLNGVVIGTEAGSGEGIDGNSGEASMTGEADIDPAWWGTTKIVEISAEVAGTEVGTASCSASISGVTCVLTILA